MSSKSALFNSAVAAALAAALLHGAPAAAAEPSQEEQLCAQSFCQRDLHVKLRREDGTNYEHTFNVFPAIVQPKWVALVTGQTVYIEADLADEAPAGGAASGAGRQLINLVAVPSVKLPAKTIMAKLEQLPDGGTVLYVTNPFAATLAFNMGVMPLATERLVKTSSCPIREGLTNVEHWPYPVFQVVLGGGRLLAKGADLSCVK